MKFYTSDGNTYEGMDQETIAQLRLELGQSTVFITKEEYDVLMQSKSI